MDYSLTDADKEYFENFWPNIANAWNNGDREPYIKGHENSIYMVPNSETLSDQIDIRSFIEEFPDCIMNYSDFDIRGNQGLVGVRGNYSLNDMNDEFIDKGKFLVLFDKTETGDWCLTHGIWNSDLPVAGL
ncbi:MAG: hypothetical protein HKN31_07075 [Pricia sp.]|nr:hypothetical protein [Pricia sp.]